MHLRQQCTACFTLCSDKRVKCHFVMRMMYKMNALINSQPVRASRCMYAQDVVGLATYRFATALLPLAQ